MTPTSHLYDERDGKHVLYLGGYCTVAGLKLFQSDDSVSEVEVYEAPEKPIPIGNLSAAALISHLSIDGAGTHDFSCVVEPNFKFSTHDDAECHFKADTKKCIRDLFLRATPPVYNQQLWEVLESNPSCYVVVDEQLNFLIYPDFDALLKASTTG